MNIRVGLAAIAVLTWTPLTLRAEDNVPTAEAVAAMPCLSIAFRPQDCTSGTCYRFATLSAKSGSDAARAIDAASRQLNLIWACLTRCTLEACSRDVRLRGLEQFQRESAFDYSTTFSAGLGFGLVYKERYVFSCQVDARVIAKKDDFVVANSLTCS